LALAVLFDAAPHKTFIDTRQVKVSADSTIKTVDADRLQETANDYDRRFADLEKEIAGLKARVANLENR